MKFWTTLLIPAILLAGSLVFFSACTPPSESVAQDKKPLSVLLIDGQNNHKWQETSPVLVEIFEGSGRFEVTVSTTPSGAPRAPRKSKEKTPEANAKFAAAMAAWEAAVKKHKEESGAAWGAWRPDFASYDVVVSNYNGELWPEPVQKALEEYVAGGGGFVSVHAANNAFPKWNGYNRMIAVGGWGGRSELSGPYLRLREGKWVQDTTAGRGGSHGRRHEFVVETQAPEHPIVKGLPKKWLHAEDELYDRLRGPAEEVTVLAAALAKEDTGGSGEYEPLLMAIDYDSGRVFHTTLGHDVVAMSGRGFAESLLRGTEWAATGEVTFPEVPESELPVDSVATR